MEENVSLIAQLIPALVTLLTTGGVVYLIVESIIDKRKRREEVKAQQVDNVEKAVSYGVPMIQIYEEIDKIVEKKIAPVMAKLSEASERIKDLEDNYCCYRDACGIRIRNKKDADSTPMTQQEFMEYERSIRTLPKAGMEEGHLHDREAARR